MLQSAWSMDNATSRVVFVLVTSGGDIYIIIQICSEGEGE